MSQLDDNSRSSVVEGATQPQDITPESEFSGADGYPRYTAAAEAFIQNLAGLVNQSDIETMIRAQKQMLQRFEKTNEMLLNCNALSQSRLKTANDDFKRHVKLLAELKKDLDYIFRKVRVIKQKLNQQYPTAFAEAQRSSLAEEAEDETEPSSSSTATATRLTSDFKRKVTMAAEVKTDDGTTIPSVKQAKNTTVEYVQMEETVENGKPIENELIKRVCSIEQTNPNDSSDCTSEDTG